MFCENYSVSSLQRAGMFSGFLLLTTTRELDILASYYTAPQSAMQLMTVLRHTHLYRFYMLVLQHLCVFGSFRPTPKKDLYNLQSSIFVISCWILLECVTTSKYLLQCQDLPGCWFSWSFARMSTTSMAAGKYSAHCRLLLFSLPKISRYVEALTAVPCHGENTQK